MTTEVSGKWERVAIPYEYFEAIRAIADMRQMKPEAVTVEILRLGFNSLEAMAHHAEVQNSLEAQARKAARTRSRRRA